MSQTTADLVRDIKATVNKDHPAEQAGIEWVKGFLDVPLAHRLLDSQRMSRGLIKSGSDQLQDVIKTDTYAGTLVTIILEENGRMATGEQTCNAVIATGKGIWVIFQLNTPYLSMAHAEGRGKRQTDAQVVSRIADAKVPGTRLPNIEMCIRVYRSLASHGGRGYKYLGNTMDLTNAVVTNYQYLNITASLLTRKDKYTVGVMKAPIAAAFSRMAHHVSPIVLTKSIETYTGKKQHSGFEDFVKFRQKVIKLGGSTHREAARFYYHGLLAVFDAMLANNAVPADQHLWLKAPKPSKKKASGFDEASPEILVAYDKLRDQYPWPEELRCGVLS